MHDLVAEFYRWLVEASLRLCVILPLLLIVAAVSRRTPSWIVCVMLATGLVMGIVSPQLPEALRITLPVLEVTRAFEPGLPTGLAGADVAVPSVPPPGSVPGARSETLPWIATGIWAAGAFFFLLRRGWQYLSSVGRFARATPVSSEHPGVKRLQQLGAGMKKGARPWLFEGEDVPGPLVHGLLHPRILVSKEFLRKDPEVQEMVFRHELAHLGRFDIVSRALLELGAILFWFHPLVHLLFRQYDRAVEMACDDAVLQDGVPSARYGEMLVAEAGETRGGRRMVKEVRQRLLSVLRGDKRRASPTPRTTVGFATLSAAALSPFAMVGFSPYPKQEPFTPLEPDARLGALWRMRVGSGDIVDDWSGHSRHGRIMGAAWVKDPERGYCLSFDGKDDILVLPAFESNWTHGPFSIAMWLKMPAHADGGGLILRGDFNQTWCAAMAHMGNSVFHTFGERELLLAAEHGPDGGADQPSPGRFPTYDGFGIKDDQSPHELPCGEWVHLAVVLTPDRTARKISFYENGTLIRTQPLDLTGVSLYNFDWLTEQWYFGRGESPPVHGNHYEGLLSDLAVFTISLNPDQVRRVMSGDFRTIREVPLTVRADATRSR